MTISEIDYPLNNWIYVKNSQPKLNGWYFVSYFHGIARERKFFDGSVWKNDEYSDDESLFGNDRRSTNHNWQQPFCKKSIVKPICEGEYLCHINYSGRPVRRYFDGKYWRYKKGSPYCMTPVLTWFERES